MACRTESKVALPNMHTLTLEKAVEALHKYNHGFYGRRAKISNKDLDARAAEKFRSGLGSTQEEIHEQVRFIGNDYGGVAGFPKALSIAPAIATAVFECKERYQAAVAGAPPLSEGSVSVTTLEFLFKPFVQSCEKKRNWLVWSTKFWHFLNPDAFVVEDSRVDRFFKLGWKPNPVSRYSRLLNAFREFELSHKEWLPELHDADDVGSKTTKLWDKVFFGLEEPEAG